MKNIKDTNKQEISRKEALQKIGNYGKYTALTAIGTYMILDMIELSQQLKLPYLYLGYYVEQSPKMAYKTRFAPCQILKDGKWVTFS